MQKAKCHTLNKDLSNIFATHFVIINSTLVDFLRIHIEFQIYAYIGIYGLFIFGLFHLAQNLLGFEDFL